MLSSTFNFSTTTGTIGRTSVLELGERLGRFEGLGAQSVFVKDREQ